MADTVDASSSTAANKFYHAFINHRGSDVKKTFASHLYHRLCSAQTGLKVFLDQPELRVGSNFGSQIIDAIRTASVHVAIFSPRYAESQWCLDELLYMLESKATIIPVFYHVDPDALRWTQNRGVYSKALQILESKKRHDPATITKWRDALHTVSMISGFDLNSGPFNGDEGALVEKIVQRVLQEIKSISEFYCSHLYGGHGNYWTDGTYSGIRRITITANQYAITSIQLHYGLDGDESLTDRSFSGGQHGGWIGNPHQGALGDRMEYSLNYPEQIITKISGHFGSYKPWPESWVVIKSLTFHTNKGKYGPCGQERGTHFETEEGGKIVGFFGSSGSLVDSIGVYMLKPRASIEEASESRENKDDRIISSSLEKLASR